MITTVDTLRTVNCRVRQPTVAVGLGQEVECAKQGVQRGSIASIVDVGPLERHNYLESGFERAEVGLRPVEVRHVHHSLPKAR